jgi:O-antigen/teichoic acid export membrane protein
MVMISAREKGLAAIKWTSLGAVLPKLTTPIFTMWLVNILDPEDFGIMSLVGAIVGFINLIQNLGLGEYIIKEQKISQNTLSVIFWANIILAFLFCLIIIISLSIYSGDDETNFINIMQVSSILIFGNSLYLVHNSLLQQKLKFKKLFFIQIIPIFSMVLCVIPLAHLGYGVWSLVLGQILSTYLNVLFYWNNIAWRPSLYFVWKEFGIVMRFGKWVTLEKIIEFIYSNVDIVVIGLIFDLKTVGLYSTAKYMLTLVYTAVNGPVGAISYPMLGSSILTRENLKKSFLSITSRIIALNIPLMFGIAITAPMIIPLIFNPKWEQLPLLIVILVVGEAVSRSLWVQRDIYKLLNLPEVYGKNLLINIILPLSLYPIFSKYGVIAFCIIKVSNDFVYFFWQLIVASKILRFRVSLFLGLFYPSIICSIIMSISLYSLLYSLEYQFNLFECLVVILISGIIYILSFRVFYNSIYEMFKSDFKKIV